MLIPIRTDSPLRTTPYMNRALLLANVIVFLIQISTGHPLSGKEGVRPAWEAAYLLNASHPQLYQFVTSGFMHDSLMHLLGNMLFLYIFGNNVNDKMGHAGYLFFYVASVVAAGMTYVMFERHGNMLGASGGVSAVTGAYLVLFPRSSITILMVLVIVGTFEIASYWFVLAFFLKDLFGLSGQSRVAHSAHVGGTVFGFVISLLLLWTNLLPRDKFDIAAIFKQWHRRRQYREMVNSGWNPYENTHASKDAGKKSWFREETQPPAEAEQVDPRTQRVLDLRAEIAEAIAHHKLPQATALYLQLRQLDPLQVLGRQNQLDVANQLASEQKYSEAAEAYEAFLRTYPKYEQSEQVELMLGIVLNRFLNQPSRAREYLIRAAAKLMDENSRSLARQELEKVELALRK